MGLHTENDLIAGYRRAILAEMVRMRQTEPKPFHAVFKLLLFEKLLSRENPPLSLEEIKEIYPLTLEEEDETEESLFGLARMIHSREIEEILHGMEKSDLLEYVIDWLGKNDFLTDQELTFWKKRALILKIQTFAQSGHVHAGRELTPHETQVYHFLKSKLQTSPLETSSFEDLQALWTLCEEPYASPLPWLEWFGNKAMWSSIEEMNDETLHAFSETLPEYIDALALWAVKTGRMEHQKLHWFRRELFLLKLKNFALSENENELFIHFASKAKSEYIAHRPLKNLEELRDILDKKPPELPKLLEWLGEENVFAIVLEMDATLFQNFYKTYPGWIGALERYAEKRKESNPEAFEKWQRLRLLAEIRQTNVDPSTIQDAKLRRVLEKLLEKIKSGDLDTESTDRLSLLAEILKGGAPAFSKLLEWIGPEKLSEWAESMDVETLASLAEMLAKLHAMGLLDLDLRKFQGILKDIAASLKGTDFKIPSVWQNFKFEGLWEKWDIKGPKIDFDAELGFDIDNPVSFDFGNLMRSIFGPDLYSIDYDFEEYRDEPLIVSGEIYQTFLNDETLHNEKENYHDSSYSYSLKAAETLLKTYPFENKIVFEKNDYLEDEKLKSLYNTNTSFPQPPLFNMLFFDQYLHPHSRWLSQCRRALEKKENSLPQETRKRLIQAGYRLLDHALEWLHFRYQQAKKEGLGGGVIGIRSTLQNLYYLLSYAKALHDDGKVDTLRWTDLGKKWIKVTDEWLDLLYEKKMEQFDERAFYFIAAMKDANDLIGTLHSYLALKEHSFPGVYKEELPENLAYYQAEKRLPHAFPLRAFTPHERRSFFNLEFHPFLKMLFRGGDPEWLMKWMTLEFNERFRALTSPDLLSDRLREKAEDERALALELLMTVDRRMLDSLPQQRSPSVETIRTLYTRNVIEGFRYWRDHPPHPPHTPHTNDERNHSFLWPVYFFTWEKNITISPYLYSSDFLSYFFLFPGINYGVNLRENERKELLQILLWELHRLEAHYARIGFSRFAKVVIWNTFFDFLIKLISSPPDTAGEISPIIDILLPETLESGFFTPHEARRKLLPISRGNAKITAIMRNYLKEWKLESLVPNYPIPNEMEAHEDLKKYLPSVYLSAQGLSPSSEELPMPAKDEILREFEKIAEGNPEPSFLFRLAFAVKRFYEKKNKIDFADVLRYEFEKKPAIQKTLEPFFYYLMILTPEHDVERSYNLTDFTENLTEYILKLTPEEESSYRIWEKMLGEKRDPIHADFLPRYPHSLLTYELKDSEKELERLRAIEFPWLRLPHKDDPAPSTVMHLSEAHSGRNIQINDLSIHYKKGGNGENRHPTIPPAATAPLSLASQLWLVHEIERHRPPWGIVLQEANKAQAIAEEIGYAYMPEEGYQPTHSTLQSYRKNLVVLDENTRQKLEEKIVSAPDLKTIPDLVDADIKPGSLDYQFDGEYYDASDLPINGIPIEWGENALVAYAPDWFLNQKIKDLDEKYPFDTLKSLVEASHGNKADISELLLFHSYQLKRRLIDASGKKDSETLNATAFSEQLLFWIDTARKEINIEKQTPFFQRGLEIINSWKHYLHSTPHAEIGSKLGEWFSELIQKEMLTVEERKKVFDPFARKFLENHDSFGIGFFSEILKENGSVIPGLSDFEEHLARKMPFLWAHIMKKTKPLSTVTDPLLRQWLEIVFQIEENSKKADPASILRWIENAFGDPKTRTSINFIRASSLLQNTSLSHVDIPFALGFYLAEWAIEVGEEKAVFALPRSVRRYAICRLLEKTRLESSAFSEEEWLHKDFYALARLRWVLSREEWEKTSKKIPVTEKLLDDFLKAPWKPSWPRAPETYDEERQKDHWISALKERSMSIESSVFSLWAGPLLLHDILQNLHQWKESRVHPNGNITSNLLKLESLIAPPSSFLADPLLVDDVKELVKRYDDFIRDERDRDERGARFQDKTFSQKLFHLSRLIPSIKLIFSLNKKETPEATSAGILSRQ